MRSWPHASSTGVVAPDDLDEPENIIQEARTCSHSTSQIADHRSKASLGQPVEPDPGARLHQALLTTPRRVASAQKRADKEGGLQRHETPWHARVAQTNSKRKETGGSERTACATQQLASKIHIAKLTLMDGHIERPLQFVLKPKLILLRHSLRTPEL